MMKDLPTTVSVPIEKRFAEPSVSIAMATYNGAQYILEQLESLAAQTMLPRELVVTDDGSTDGTIGVVEAFAVSAPFPTRIYRNEARLGYSENFLKAASLCNSKLIAFCDQDDVWLNNKLEKSSQVFEAEDVMLSIHSAKVWYGLDRFGPNMPDIKFPKSFERLSVDPFQGGNLGFAIVVRCELLRMAAGWRRLADPKNHDGRRMAHDQWVWFLASIFGRIVTISEPLAFYRQHTSNTFGIDQKAKTGLVTDISKSFKTTDYAGLAARQAENSTDIVALAQCLAEPYRTYSLDAAALFANRANFLMLRSKIYGTNRFTYRFKALFSILISGGYRPDSRIFRPGFRAILKDIFFGLTGLYKRNL